jgi:hypothetical protein
MEITKDIRNQQFDTASDTAVYLYSHYLSGEKLFQIAQSYNLVEPQQYRIFATTVGDIILGFYQIEDTVPLLQQELGIDATTAGLLGADVLEFLAPLSDPNFVVPLDPDDAEVEEGSAVVTTETTTTPTDGSHPSASFYVPPNSATIPVGVVPAATPADGPHMPPLRTMASDMARSPERAAYEPIVENETPIYSSKQPEVRTPLSDLPAYTTLTENKAPAPQPTIETPRWGA